MLLQFLCPMDRVQRQRCQPLQFFHNLYKISQQLRHYDQRTKKLWIFALNTLYAFLLCFIWKVNAQSAFPFYYWYFLLLQQLCIYVNVQVCSDPFQLLSKLISDQLSHVLSFQLVFACSQSEQVIITVGSKAWIMETLFLNVFRLQYPYQAYKSSCLLNKCI